MRVGKGGPPPGEIVDGLRNPYLDQYVPPRRREASEAYRNYKPLRLKYVHHPITDLDVPNEGMLDSALDDLEARLKSGAPFRLPTGSCMWCGTANT